MSVNNFQVIQRLGDGAYSSVYKVKRHDDGEVYALKKVKLMNLSQKEKLNALNEVRILASIRHPNVIGYKEAFLDDKSNSLCIVMEYCDGGDLFQKICQYQKKNQLFPEKEIFSILVQIVKGLQELHQLKIFHRDLKSANVFLCKDGSVKLGDMNVSKVAKKGLLYTQTGTPYYASPEVWKDQPYESKSDIWSLGCVLYEMTTLKPPFRAEDMEGLYKRVIRGQYPKIPSHYSADLGAVIKQLLQVNPHMRPSSEKILQLPGLVRHMRESNFEHLESEEGNNNLLQTIKVPRNLHFLTDRLPKPNYTPLKTKKVLKKSLYKTTSNDIKNNQGIDTKQLLPKINDGIGERNLKIKNNNSSINTNIRYNRNNSNLYNPQIQKGIGKQDYKSVSLERNSKIQPIVKKKNYNEIDKLINSPKHNRGVSMKINSRLNMEEIDKILGNEEKALEQMKQQRLQQKQKKELVQNSKQNNKKENQDELNQILKKQIKLQDQENRIINEGKHIMQNQQNKKYQQKDQKQNNQNTPNSQNKAKKERIQSPLDKYLDKQNGLPYLNNNLNVNNQDNGEGAYSSVYKVLRLHDNQEYALKKVKLMNLSEKEKQNALNEVRILASIRSQAIVGYKEAFIDESSNSLCICMEYSNNGDLFQKITEYQKKGQLFSEQEIWHIFIQIVKGLKALHDLRIFHRDLKSANVFLGKDGTAKLGDMNVSKVAKKGLLYTQTGTPYYASPEVWKDQPYDSKSDIWSLGCVLYEMTTLKPPFRAEDMEGLFKKVIRGYYPRIPPHYSPDLNNVIRALLQVAPHLRPSADKILQLPAVQKRMNDAHLIESDEGIPQLLNTIRIPKNLGNLKERMPQPNYTGLKTKKLEKHAFQSTLGTNSTNTHQDKVNTKQSTDFENPSGNYLPKIKGGSKINSNNRDQENNQIYNNQNHNEDSTSNGQTSPIHVRQKHQNGNSIHINQQQQEDISENQIGKDASLARNQQQQKYYNNEKQIRQIQHHNNNNQVGINKDNIENLQGNSIIHKKPKPIKQGVRKNGYEREVLKNRNYMNDDYEKQYIYEQDKKIKQIIDIHSIKNQSQNDQYDLIDRSNLHKIYSLKPKKNYDPYTGRQRQKVNQYKNILDIEGESKPIMAKGYGKNRQPYKNHQKQEELYMREERQGKLPQIGGRLPKISSQSQDNSSLLPMIQGQNKLMGIQQQEKDGQKIREISRAYKVNIGHLDELKERYRQIKRLENQKRDKYKDYLSQNQSLPHSRLDNPKYSKYQKNI
ncbi:Protein kinase-like domain [Pseudocohnilembus persalinus]|uniref:non-specific serine/threonine protein kinase n=1 Tax=Pseudocohnilembus persalinus TaxID=266149 RepID=A0A0V0R0B6_PSEPJ|nr:Protein kinase-like domain [Pseudocohnilembus persalinus]|eukprot:KRX07956.1 Protein kinase-like domain [Pseudocohnilembus persalinus]